MLSTFQRNLIIKKLQSKYEHWKNPETKFTFYKGMPTNSQIPNFGIERDESGYFYLSDNLIAYCNLLNGYVCRIRRNWSQQDWDCYTELYQLGKQNNLFRIDIPLYKQEVFLDNYQWEYAELQSPNMDYGRNYNDDVFSWPELTNGIQVNPNITEDFKDSVAVYYKEFADQTAEILTYAIQVSKKYDTGLPGRLCRPSTRFKDSDGYFWSDFDQDSWIHEKDEVINYALIIFEGSLQFAKVCGVLDDNRIKDCMDYVRAKWTTI